MQFVSQSRLELCRIAGKGRGVVAQEPITVGTLIATAPTVPPDAPQGDLVEQPPLGDYYFANGSDPEAGFLVFGITSFLNHSEAPNTDIAWRLDPRTGWVVDLLAVRDIAGGTELTRRYACAPWFEPVQ